MNEEQTKPDQASDVTQNSGNVNEPNNDKPADEYYAVDDPKKEFNTTIGDGEMHNEGLVGDGTVTDEDNAFSEGTTAAQDEAENHDSEG